MMIPCYPVSFGALFLAVGILNTNTVAGQEDCAHVTGVSVTESSPGIYTFATTISSNETGWDKYADEWRIVDTDTMTILGVRELAHPHVTEQPFTRSLTGVSVPPTVQTITVEAQDSVLGYCGETVELGWSVTGNSWTVTVNSTGTFSTSTGGTTAGISTSGNGVTSGSITTTSETTGNSTSSSVSATASSTTTTTTGGSTSTSTSSSGSSSSGDQGQISEDKNSFSAAATISLMKCSLIWVSCLLLL